MPKNQHLIDHLCAVRDEMHFPNPWIIHNTTPDIEAHWISKNDNAAEHLIFRHLEKFAHSGKHEIFIATNDEETGLAISRPESVSISKATLSQMLEKTLSLRPAKNYQINVCITDWQESVFLIRIHRREKHQEPHRKSILHGIIALFAVMLGVILGFRMKPRKNTTNHEKYATLSTGSSTCLSAAPTRRSTDDG